MPLYTYKVRNKAGKILSGESKMKSEADLRTALELKELIPLEIKEKNALTDISQISFLKQKVKLKDLAIFCRQFAIVLEAGVPMASAMEVLRDQATNPTLKATLSDLYADIQKGIQLSTSMKKHLSVFPEMLVNMVESGEVSGQLDRVFVRMADNYEKEFKLNQKIKGTLTYPVIVCIVAVGVIFVLMTTVVPSFAKILQGFGATLPIFTKILIDISNFFKSFWWLMVGIIVGTVVAGKAFSKSYDGKIFFGKMAMTLPVINGVTRSIMTARMTRTLSTLMSSGVLLIQAMDIVQKILGNAVVSQRIEGVISEIKKGKGLTQPLSAMKYFPPMLISMIRIGEESGDLDFALDKSADFFDQEVEVAMQKLTAMIEPIVMITLAAVVGFIIISVLYPMFSIYQTMSV